MRGIKLPYYTILPRQRPAKPGASPKLLLLACWVDRHGSMAICADVLSARLPAFDFVRRGGLHTWQGGYTDRMV